ncbi:MAG: phenylalanine--tRNA ligase subunit beta, partial [Rickettsiales bacterium]|nr:phenylalanine--tRNA ligase subunit beta [Rickettsiales bacterium]
RRLGIESDAKYRFERGIDPASTEWGMEFATKLILDICGGEASKVSKTGSNPYKKTTIEFPAGYFEKRIGLKLDKKTAAGILGRLGCEIEEKSNALSVTPPSWRGDLEAKEDITEELIRIYGYDKMPANPVTAEGMKPVLDARQARNSTARRLLASRGLVEVYTWSFMSSKKESDVRQPIRLANPITAELDVMRQSIIPNLLDGVSANMARSVRSSHLFEIAPAYKSTRPGDQRTYASAVRSGNMRDKDWSAQGASASAYDVKEDALALLGLYGIDAAKVRYSTDGPPSWAHPYKSAAIIYANQTVGYFGEAHPLALKRHGIKNASAAAFEIDLDALPAGARKTPAKKKLALSEFQPIERDFAFAFDKNTPADEILRAVKSASDSIAEARIFDIYTGANLGGKKSVAVSATIVPSGKTFTEAEIQAISEKIIANAAKLGGELRDK